MQFCIQRVLGFRPSSPVQVNMILQKRLANYMARWSRGSRVNARSLCPNMFNTWIMEPSLIFHQMEIVSNCKSNFRYEMYELHNFRPCGTISYSWTDTPPVVVLPWLLNEVRNCASIMTALTWNVTIDDSSFLYNYWPYSMYCLISDHVLSQLIILKVTETSVDGKLPGILTARAVEATIARIATALPWPSRSTVRGIFISLFSISMLLKAPDFSSSVTRPLYMTWKWMRNLLLLDWLGLLAVSFISAITWPWAAMSWRWHQGQRPTSLRWPLTKSSCRTQAGMSAWMTFSINH